jgi:hypothetical protein
MIYARKYKYENFISYNSDSGNLIHWSLYFTVAEWEPQGAASQFGSVCGSNSSGSTNYEHNDI